MPPHPTTPHHHPPEVRTTLLAESPHHESQPSPRAGLRVRVVVGGVGGWVRNPLILMSFPRESEPHLTAEGQAHVERPAENMRLMQEVVDCDQRSSGSCCCCCCASAASEVLLLYKQRDINNSCGF